MSETIDYDSNIFAQGRFAGDRNGVVARFYTMPVLDEAKSAEEGRPMHREREFVEIIAPGNQNNIVQRRATDQDRQRFAREYEMFKQGHQDQLVGTPLSEVPWLNRSQIQELYHMRIRTLEQLAEVSDSVCGSMAGLYDIKRRAKQMMEAAASAAPLTKLQGENEELKKQLEELRLEMEEIRKGRADAAKSKS